MYKGRDEHGKRLKPYTKTWKAPENWSDTKVQKELNRIATLFEEERKGGLAVSYTHLDVYKRQDPVSANIYMHIFQNFCILF